MNYNPELKELTAEDLGWTQDEFNNFRISIWEMLNKKDEPNVERQVNITCGDGVTITLTKDSFCKK